MADWTLIGVRPHNDQEFDLGHGWWISLGDSSPWHWEVLDNFTYDEATIKAEGKAETEDDAKRQALCEALGSMPSYTKVVVVDGYTDKAHTYLARDLPQHPLREEGRRLTNLDLGTEFFIRQNTPIVSVEIIEFDGKG